MIYRKQCMCELGGDCTRTTVCAMHGLYDEIEHQQGVIEALTDRIKELEKREREIKETRRGGEESTCPENMSI